MSAPRRTQLLLDRVQLVLVGRIVGYWCFCLLAVMLMACCWTIWTERPGSSAELIAKVLHHYAPVLAATIVVLPLVVIDAMRLSHRFVGPVFRLRQALRQAAEGQDVEPIRLRSTDFWIDVVEDFNRAMADAAEPPTHAA
jgi:hypothetical protein